MHKEKLILVLTKLKFSKSDIKHISLLNFEKTIAFHFWREPERVDFLTKITGVTFEEAEKEVNNITLDSIEVPVIHYNHLIRSKITSNRAKDKADVEELQKIKRK